MNTKRIFFIATAVILAACTQLENPTESNVPVSLSYSTVNAVESKAAQNLNEGTFASGESVKVRRCWRVDGLYLHHRLCRGHDSPESRTVLSGRFSEY